MNCDDVFDLLTGERRADSHDCREAMKRHLAHCRSCRRMADALEPAVQLFHECSAHEDYDGEDFAAPTLHGPWEECVEEHEERSQLVRHRGRPNPGPFASSDLLRLAAAILVGLTLGALVWGRSDEPSERSVAESRLEISAPRVNTQRPPAVSLVAMQLTMDCVPAEHRASRVPTGPRLRPAGELLTSAQLEALACCTLCHASQGLAPHTKAATSEVVRSCQACHTF